MFYLWPFRTTTEPSESKLLVLPCSLLFRNALVKLTQLNTFMPDSCPLQSLRVGCWAVHLEHFGDHRPLGHLNTSNEQASTALCPSRFIFVLCLFWPVVKYTPNVHFFTNKINNCKLTVVVSLCKNWFIWHLLTYSIAPSCNIAHHQPQWLLGL